MCVCGGGGGGVRACVCVSTYNLYILILGDMYECNYFWV